MAQQIDILFIDDQWCRPKDQSTIVAAFGPLQRREIPYVFHYETAESSPGIYSVEPVLRTISSIANLRAIILDIMFGDTSDRLGLDILSAIRGKYPTLPVFMMTSIEGNIDVIERAMELGANEFLVKKPTLDVLENLLKIYTQPSSIEADYAIWGNSEPIRQIRARIARVAAGGSDKDLFRASVLVTGESGTGKELVARAIHRQGTRKRGPFIEKNCAYEKSDLLDSDLFGHERGAYTGAEKQYKGRIERADTGILFLDEIGNMSHELQGKLLRVLETHNFQRLGSEQVLKSDFQLICATNADPEKMVKEGLLREDLYYRIKLIEIHVPPLLDRQGDIPILANLFLKKFRDTSGASYSATSFSADAIDRLSTYRWPGNVRELKNTVERAAILCRGKQITLSDLPQNISESFPAPHLDNAGHHATGLPADPTQWGRHLAITQLQFLAEALELFNGNATLAVKHLFPMVNSPNATYLKRFIKRLQERPWGYLAVEDEEINKLVDRIENYSRKSK